MRRPDGKMSKKDRRALLAFGITPAEDRVAVNAQPITIFTDSFTRANGNVGTLWLNTNGTLNVQTQQGWQVVTSQPVTWTWR